MNCKTVKKTAVAVCTACFFAFFSCSRSEFEPQEPSGLENYTLRISSDETKTGILPSDSSKYLSVWLADDKFQIYIDDLSASSGKKYVLTNNVSGRMATFMGSVGTSEGEHTIYGFYPSEALVSGSDTYQEGNFTLSVDVPARQNPTLTSFDPLCDILVAEPLDVTFAQSGHVEVKDARFSRKMALVKLLPRDATTGKALASDVVTAVKMSSAGGNTLTGRAQLNIRSGEIEKWTSQSSNSYVSAYYDTDDGFAINGSNASFLAVTPGTLPSGGTLDFEIGTDRHVLNKHVTLSKDIVLKEGQVAVLGVSFDDGCVSESGAALPFEEDFSSIKKGNNTTSDGTKESWSGNENFPTVTYAYQAGGAVKIGTASHTGSLTSKALNLSTPFTVTFKVKGWTSAGQVTVTCGSQSKTVGYTQTQKGSWECDTLSFFGESAVANLVISTLSDSPRCYIDDVSITSGKKEAHEIVLSAEQVTLGASVGQTATFTVRADCDWTASLTDGSGGFSWSPPEGTAQELVTVTVTASSENTGSSSVLLGGLRISDGTASKTVSVYQSAPAGPSGAGWAELPAVTEGDNLETCRHDRLPSNSSLRNFSFLFDKEKHCALWVAWPLHSCYMGSAGRQNAFDYDPVYIDNDFEANIGSNAYYPKGGSSYSHARGHQMPSAERTVSESDNITTFYATNMTPQLQDFNGNIWETLESWERGTYVCSDTLYIITGPYFDPDATPTYAYDNKGLGKACQVPTHYWKIFLRTKSGNTGKNVRDCSASELKCVGFWFEHKKRTGNPVASDLRSVAEIEALTGFTFFPNVPNAPKSTYSASDWGL